MKIKQGITYQAYEKIIDYAFSKSDAVMFVFRKDGFNESQVDELEKTRSEFEKNYKDYILKHRNGAHWVYTKVGNEECGITSQKDPKGFQNLFDIYFLSTKSKIKEYLLKNKNFYNWLNPKYPEDISFFKNGYCWLYSVSHEQFIEIYCEKEEEYLLFRQIGLEFEEKKFLATPIEEMYYESYQKNSN